MNTTGLTIWRSHRVERLAAQLSAQLGGPCADPMAPDHVVVGGLGMERWLATQLATQAGIVANVRFPTPAGLVDALWPEGVDDAWSPSRLPWRVARVLEAQLHAPGFEELRRYLEGHAPGSRRWVALADRVADLLDRYAQWRPDWLARWRDHEAHWQAALWRALLQDAPSALDPVSAQRQLLERVRGGAPLGALAGGRLAVFGLSAAPPAWLELLAALGQRRPIDFYVLASSERECATLASLGALDHPTALRQACEAQAHPLSVSLGAAGRELHYRLAQLTGATVRPLFDEQPGASSVLARLQHDLVQGAPARCPEAPADSSVSFHACHGPTRQLEVLRDQLLEAFEQLPGLEPRDVLVMCPNIEAWAPLIDAVFSDGERDAPAAVGFPRIPFSLADTSRRTDNPAAGALLQVLALEHERLTVPQVLDLLAFQPVRTRFDLSADDVDQIRRWADRAAIRWGLDAAHREREGRPPDSAFTWRQGLDRLLLGLALSPSPDEHFAGLEAADLVEGGATQMLGALVQLMDALGQGLRGLGQPCAPAEWRERLLGLVDALLDARGVDAWQLSALRAAIVSALRPAEAERQSRLELPALRQLLEQALSRVCSNPRFVSGGVTFCTLTPMRSIPFRVIALLGMDDDVFPRRPSALGFDHLSAAPRIGDRRPADDDRYQVLEAVLAARDRLIVTWSGRDPLDNKERPPAVPVADLLDTVATQVRAPDESLAQARHRLVRVAPLQPFDAQLFASGQSYDLRMLQGAEAERGERLGLEPFVRGPLAARPAPEDLSLDRLARFLESPVRYWVQHRLGVTLEGAPEQPRDEDPEELKGLEGWQVKDRLLRGALADQPVEQQLAAARRLGLLPTGLLGELALERADHEVRYIHEVARPYLTHPFSTVSLAGRSPQGGPRLSGRLEHLVGPGRAVVTPSRRDVKRWFRAWLEHLALSALHPEYSGHTVLVGRPGGPKDPVVAHRLRSLGPTFEARQAAAWPLLDALVGVYLEGQAVPVPFHAAAGWELVNGADPLDHEQRLAKATRVWTESYEGLNCPHVRRVFGDAGPHQHASRGLELPEHLHFEAVSERLLRPMAEHFEEITRS